MFAKCWEISRIFQRAEAGDISPFKELPWWMFCRAFFGVVFFETVFLLIWFVVDPPTSTISLVDTVNLLAIHECVVQYPGSWYGLHFTYFAIVLIWGAYLAYQTRDIWQKYNYPNESRSILMSIYNLAFCAVILVPLLTVLGASPDVLFFLISVAIIFPTSFALIVVHGPKMVAFIASSVRGGSKGSRGSKGTRDKMGSARGAAPHQIQPYQPDMSHTVKLLKTLEGKEKEKEKEREHSIVSEEVELQPIMGQSGGSGGGTPPEKGNPGTPQHLKGTRSIEDPKVAKQAPSLASTWKVLTSPQSVAITIKPGQFLSASQSHSGEMGQSSQGPSSSGDEEPVDDGLTESRNPLFDSDLPKDLLRTSSL
jgi:hypothetical protein